MHTPTPWIMIEEGDGGGRGIAAICGRDGDTVVAAIRGAVTIDGEPHPENMANASLILAAPDLLEAAKSALTLLDAWLADGSVTTGTFTQEQLRSAIAKATA